MVVTRSQARKASVVSSRSKARARCEVIIVNSSSVTRPASRARTVRNSQPSDMIASSSVQGPINATHLRSTHHELEKRVVFLEADRQRLKDAKEGLVLRFGHLGMRHAHTHFDLEASKIRESEQRVTISLLKEEVQHLQSLLIRPEVGGVMKIKVEEVKIETKVEIQREPKVESQE